MPGLKSTLFCVRVALTDHTIPSFCPFADSEMRPPGQTAVLGEPVATAVVVNVEVVGLKPNALSGESFGHTYMRVPTFAPPVQMIGEP